VVEPVAARLTRALGVLAPHEASAKTVPASSPNRMIVTLSAGIATPKARTSSTRSGVADSSGIRQASIPRAHRYRFASRASVPATAEQTPAWDELRARGQRRTARASGEVERPRQNACRVRLGRGVTRSYSSKRSRFESDVARKSMVWVNCTDP
jgi:hypothetical protein